ncbi:MAG: glycosyl transferase [Devosia sp.]|uniref:glycosyltransferase family 2 protein n=1 Tax=Devosia sp. TaxID=1871048 RepID=UPI002618239B|nr:glycosyltransferase family 2 protein [Devosia sp.]MDB5538940.1 glycosyl transferase [Devosia sp.]
MNKPPRFSVVVPCFNYGAMLPIALESILTQERDDVEVILVDDASTDDTPAIATRYRGRIRYLRNGSNRGHPYSWGRAMQEARGEFIVNLDADDWLLPNYFSRVERALDEDVGMVVSSVYDYRMEGGTIALRSIAPQDERLSADTFRRRLLGRIFFRTPGMLVRRSLAAAASPPDPRIWNADWEFLLRATRGAGAFVIAEPLAVYRIHAHSISGAAKANTQRLRKSCQLFLDITRDSAGQAFLERRERKRFAVGLSKLYLRIVGSRMGPKDAASAVSHLRFAMALSGSEDPPGALSTLAFFARSVADRIVASVAPKGSVSVSVTDLMPPTPAWSEGE